MASDVPLFILEPNWEGPRGSGSPGRGVCRRLSTIRSRVLLTTFRRCMDLQLLGIVYVGLLALGIGTIVAIFHERGWWPDLRTSVYIVLRQVGCTE